MNSLSPLTRVPPAVSHRAAYRPPTPKPLSGPPGTLALLAGLWRNSLSIIGERHYEELIVTGQTPIGHISILSAPEAVHHVLVARAENYPKDKRQLRILQPGLKTGLLTSSGENWKVARRTLAPLFTPRGVQAQAEGMLKCAVATAERLARRPGRVDAGREMAQLTFDILHEVLFSGGTCTTSREFTASLDRYFHSAGRVDPLDALGAPDWIPRPGLLYARPAIAYFENLVERIVTTRATAMEAGTAPGDLLTRLLQARDPQTGAALPHADIAGSIITFIGAGHETTANALAWTLFLLAKHPDVLARVEAEIGAPRSADLAQWPDELPLTRAVIEEAMRLYPPAPVMARVALEEDEVLGHKIPAGSTAIVAPYIVHRHKKLWDDPDYFRPERFLPGAREKIPVGAFFPFGMGPRVCIGKPFSMLEGVIALATILRRVRFTMRPSDTVFPVHHVTLRPSPALIMTCSRRDGAPL